MPHVEFSVDYGYVSECTGLAVEHWTQTQRLQIQCCSHMQSQASC